MIQGEVSLGGQGLALLFPVDTLSGILEKFEALTALVRVTHCSAPYDPGEVQVETMSMPVDIEGLLLDFLFSNYMDRTAISAVQFTNLASLLDVSEKDLVETAVRLHDRDEITMQGADHARMTAAQARAHDLSGKRESIDRCKCAHAVKLHTNSRCLIEGCRCPG